MKIRKSFSRMPLAERNAFLAALMQMKNTLANPMEPDVTRHISIYDQFVLIHNSADQGISLNGAASVDPAHQGSAFGPWHREFLLRFELALQSFDATVMLPYWDWTDSVGNANVLFDDLGMGTDGDPLNGDQIQNGYLAQDRPGSGVNVTPLPAWYPPTMNGWQCDPRLVINATYNNLRRNLGLFTGLATQVHVRNTLNTPAAPAATDALTYMTFRTQLEGGTRMHNNTHNWFGVGSHMRSPSQSPNDPMFFLHHCQCDRLWALWQMDNHEGASFYQVAGGAQGHNLAQPLWPWIGGLAGYTASYVTADLVLPDYSAEVPRTATDVINHREIVLNGVDVGYAYDSQVVVGIALDRTGSMTGMTPDPLTGMAPNVIKWDAAKLGVGHFLLDAEAAYLAAESYVVAGVNTFRSTGGINEVLPVSGAIPAYGLVKGGSPYDQVAFNADIAGVIAQGGTPLAAALTETEDNLVRPPFSNQPDAEQRYMCILTDGIETSNPLLTTLATPEFPDTIIFGLGFGIGNGWNGIDFATIDTIISKGKTAPIGVQQSFFGSNVNVINNFFSKSITHTMGFVPAVDPRYEVFPGEMVMTPFEVNCSDQVFMITIQGYDFEDKNWAFSLQGPNGAMYMNAMDTPYFITMVRRDARCTIFLNRSHGPVLGWEGTWNVMATYMPNSKDEYMYMANENELLIHSGAPALLGSRFTKLTQAANKRIPVRLMEPKVKGPMPHPRGYVNTGTPATLAVNIYSKGAVSVTVDAQVKKPFAGNDIEMAIKLDDFSYGTIKSLSARGRVIAPNYSLGNLLLDFKTIPKAKRKKYFDKNNSVNSFHTLNYLIDYEKLNPTAFDLRDESFQFRVDPDGTLKGVINKTRFPGSYKIGILVEGIIQRPDGCTERIRRVLNTEVALGIQPTAKRTKPKLEWIDTNKFIVRFTPIDKFGNIALPSDTGSIQLLHQRRALTFERIDRMDGVFEMAVTIDAKGSKFNKSRNCFNKIVKLETPCDKSISIAPDTPLKFSVRIGSTVLPVEI
jgi:hypothetical protein